MSYPDVVDDLLARIRAAREALEAGHSGLVQYLRRLEDAYAHLLADNKRLDRENRELRGEPPTLDDTVPMPRVDHRRPPRHGLRRRAQNSGIPNQPRPTNRQPPETRPR